MSAAGDGPGALSADWILENTGLAAPTRVNIPEWGGAVYVREMSGVERDAFELASMVGEGKGTHFSRENIRARLAVACVCNERGELLFGPAQAAQLGQKSARALNRIWEVAAPLNGLTDADVEALAGNSDADRSA